MYNIFFPNQKQFDELFSSLFDFGFLFGNFLQLWLLFLQGLYRGFTISCVGIFIYRGMYFGLYDSLKPILLGADASVLMSFLLGWGVTIFSGTYFFLFIQINAKEGGIWPKLGHFQPKINMTASFQDFCDWLKDET